MDCNGNIYNIGMGCCEPMLGPIENYYTKPATDRRIQEEISGISAVTIDEVQEMIDEAVSGKQDTLIAGDGIIIDENNVISTSGSVTEEKMNEAIASAKTEIEAEIPSLDGYATEQWVEDKHYITGIDLSDYALKSELPVVPTSNTAFTNDAGYLTEHQSLSGYATEAFVSAFTYDKATIDEKVAGGGSFDPSQYYNKTATDALLDEKLDVTAYTPTDLSNYYTTGETVNLVESAVTRVEGEIPTVPTSNTAFTNDAGYLTEHQSLSAYSTTDEVNSAITQAVSGKQDTLSAGTNITIIDNVISAQGGGKVIKAGRGISITTGATADTVSFNLPISAGTGTNSISEGAITTASGDYSHAEGYYSNAQAEASHAEGYSTARDSYCHSEGYATIAYGFRSHAEGAESVASGDTSHAEGKDTRTSNYAEHASGAFNVSHKENTIFGGSGNTLFSIGNGTADDARHNAFEIRQNGDIYIQSGNTDIKLQDHLGGGGITSGEVQTMIDSSISGKADSSAVTQEITTSVSGKVDTSAFTAYSASTQTVINNKADSSTLNNYMLKSQIWCGTEAEWSQISGSTDPDTIYLIHS